MFLFTLKDDSKKIGFVASRVRFDPLTRFRRTSDGEVIRGPEQGFDFVASAVVIFSADLKSYISHPLTLSLTGS